jgi:triacylglycerol esterase/lipase EstA (alpha/beta hydrolase family)
METPDGQWQLVGPLVPTWVWRSHLKRAIGHDGERILWAPLRRREAAMLSRGVGAHGQRSLLLVHGTGLPTDEGFRGLSAEDHATLRARYGDRILAWEHKAITHRIERNARDLLRALCACGVPLDLDIIGLSRGGLVARWIAEGWADDIAGSERVHVERVVFVGTPNGGTPSARRDPRGRGAALMKAWRTDVRRLTRVGGLEGDVELHDAIDDIEGFGRPDRPLGYWPMLKGSQDQLPLARPLARLNGFDRPAPGRDREAGYFGVAAVFSFEHGAPDAVVQPWGVSRSTITAWAFRDAPNDLVVPTRSVFAPPQGTAQTGRFPLPRHALMVLAPSANATHTSLMLLGAVRRQILDWLVE